MRPSTIAQTVSKESLDPQAPVKAEVGPEILATDGD